MGFWKKWFGRKKTEEASDGQDWEDAVAYDGSEVDFTDSVQRRQYVEECLEQAADAAREKDLLSGEYAQVTSYLTDIDEIEALPEEEREALNGIARRMVSFVRERERYQGKKNRMKDADYYRLRQQEDQIQQGIDKLKECERYGALVQEDMKRLDRERHAYAYRRTELETMMDNLRGMAFIFLTALAACVLMLLVLQFAFQMNTKIGYVLAGGAAAVAVTVLWIKYTDAEREKHRVINAVNRLILLQNKVKIRYVNNKNLQEYLCLKYNTESGQALEKLWKQYQQEKEERKVYAEAEAKLDYYQKQLLARMSNYHIADPGRWTNQPEALLDKREMVEIRHELILRRQALRKQMDYNDGVAGRARGEIMDIVKRYPAYGEEILAMAGKYEDG